MPESSSASAFAIALLEELCRGGVSHVVVCPGSRSQSLALAAADGERRGRWVLHVRIDERSAGFFALGIGLETGRPAVLITTSGTAVANLHPAVLEAHHGGVPLIVITADRPAELRGIAANQATVQPGMFAGAPRWSADLPAPTGAAHEAALASDIARQAIAHSWGVGGPPGPVHLNIAFREPLSGPVPAPLTPRAFTPDPAPSAEPVPFELEPGPRTIVVAGDKAGPAAERLARRAGWPLIAEVTSGSRFGPQLVPAYRQVLNLPEFGGQVQRAVIFGHPTLSREVPELLARPEVESIVVGSTGGERFNPGRRVRRFVDAVAVPGPSPTAATPWLRGWVNAGRALHAAGSEDIPTTGVARLELAALRAPVTRRALVEAVWRSSWPHDRLLFGASRLIREADRVVAGKNIPVHANRGLAGIDGTISTALGVAVAAAGAPGGCTRVLLGDLAFLHDVGALLWAADEPPPRLQVIVGNDGGGTIFDGLEVAATAPAEQVDRVLYTPRSVRLEALADAYGWVHTLARTRGELDSALTAAHSELSIVEVPLAR